MDKIKLKTTTEIGSIIKKERKAQAISQEELAGLAGTGVRFISDLENGKQTILLVRLLVVLAVV